MHVVRAESAHGVQIDRLGVILVENAGSAVVDGECRVTDGTVARGNQRHNHHA